MSDDTTLEIIHTDVKYIRERIDTIQVKVSDHDTRIKVLETVDKISSDMDKMRAQFRRFVIIASIGLASLLVGVAFHLMGLL